MARPRKDGTPARGNPGGKKPYVRTPEIGKQVETMTGYGLTQPQIAELLGISCDTLRRHYRKELDTGVAKANSLVAQNLFKIATSDGSGAVAASIFWMKTRGGWREITRQEVTGADGGAIQIERKPMINWALLSPEAREAAKMVLLEAKALQEGTIINQGEDE